MPDKDDLKDIPDEDEDWMSYANTGFGSTDYSLWDDAGEEAEIVAEPDWDDEDLQLDTGEEEILRLQASRTQASSENWICNHCLGRVGGKKSSASQHMNQALRLGHKLLKQILPWLLQGDKPTMSIL